MVNNANPQTSQPRPLAPIAQALRDRGYLILKNRGKRPLSVAGWNVPGAHAVPSVRAWRGAPSIGVIIADGLGVIDIDVDHEMAGALLDDIAAIAPDVGKRAPSRFGGGTYKLALFVRIDGALFTRIASHRYVDNSGEKHCLEVYGGARTARGNYSRQFGAYGAHTVADDGRIEREYAWADGIAALHEVDKVALPALTEAQAGEICAAFERRAQALGWVVAADVDANNSGLAYDITELSRFDCADGRDQVEYAALREGDRCSASFFDPSAVNRTKCQAFFSHRFDCIGIYDYETCVAHYPAELAPVDMSAGLPGLAAVVASGPRVISAPNWRDRTAAGAPRATLANAELAIAAMGAVCSYDLMRDREMIGRADASAPGEPLPLWAGQMTDTRLRLLRGEIDRLFGIDLTEKHVFDAATNMAHRNCFDPVLDMLADAQAAWDGTSRLARIGDYFGVENTPLNLAFFRKVLVAAVARARVPGIKFDTILVMESAEGWSKSSGWAVMAGEDYFSDVAIIGQREREVMEALKGIWIHENAELAGMKKADVDAVKAFASRQVDRARPVYGRKPIEQPRRSIEVATTNSDVYLQSQTGNRRFWPVRLVRPVDLAALRRDRLQIWGEAATLQASGESLFLEQSLWAEAGAVQAKRRVRDPWEGLLEGLRVSPAGAMGTHPPGSLFIVKAVGDEERVRSADLMGLLLAMRMAHGAPNEERRLADVMRHIGWSSDVFRWEGTTARGYSRKVKTVTG